jgi:hypothetical protein
VLVELVDVFLRRTDLVCKAELDGVVAVKGEMDGDAYGSNLAAGEENELGSGGCERDADLEVVAVVEGDAESSVGAVDGKGAVSGEDGGVKVRVEVVSEGHAEMVVGNIGGGVLVEVEAS